MKYRLLIAILGIFLTTFLAARPTKPVISTTTQPDGSTFISRSYGDEFIKITTTEQGHAIIRDNDGWWCYAIYNSDGTKYSSGYHVGADAPATVLTGSLSIPHEALAKRADLMRNPAGLETKESILKKISKAQGARLLSDSKTTKHGIVILAEYSDVKFRHSRQELVDIVTKKGYSVNGATGCAKDYFDSQFNGMYEFVFDVSPIVTLSGRRAYYGQNDEYGNDAYPAEMIVEACELADEAMDFSLYDDDGDSYVDNVFVFFAGEDEAEDPTNNADCIWSHSWYVKSGAGIILNLDGKRIDQYACTSELKREIKGYSLTGIGTFCHEFSHTLGLPDFYDTNYDENGWALGLWNSTSIMDGGNSNNDSNTPPFFNVIEREIMGLTEPQVLTHNGTYTLKPIHAGGNTYKIASDSPDEYYLLECRGNKEWDEYIGGNGLLIYHIDKSNKRAWEVDNAVNVNPQRQMADLIEADGRSDRTTSMTGYASMISNISGIFYPYVSSNTSFSSDTTPGIRFRNGSKTTISITDITRDGENVTFTVTGLKGEEPPIPVNVKAEAFMDAAILNFESDRPFEGEAVVVWGRTDGLQQEVIVSPYETGKYSLVVEGLTPGNKTYKATICFRINETSGESKKVSFMTSREVPVSWPYIHFGKSANEDGTFSIGAKIPMRVYNASQAEAVEWEFNGKKSGPGGNGYFIVSEPGTLRAIVYWPDGSTDILEKEIILSE